MWTKNPKNPNSHLLKPSQPLKTPLTNPDNPAKGQDKNPTKTIKPNHKNPTLKSNNPCRIPPKALNKIVTPKNKKWWTSWDSVHLPRPKNKTTLKALYKQFSKTLQLLESIDNIWTGQAISTENSMPCDFLWEFICYHFRFPDILLPFHT